MNIILHATKAELLQLLSQATNSRITDFVVLKGPKVGDVLAPFLANMAHSMNVALVDPNTPCPPSEKIPYIKALREATAIKNSDGSSTVIYDLGQAKSAVENWVKFCNFIRVNGKLPTKFAWKDGCYGTGDIILS